VGWLHCRGQVVSRATYPDLFTAIGTQYNTGGEAGTDFRLPDMRGYRPAGVDDIGGTAAGRLNFANATNRGNAIGNKAMHPHTHTYTASGTTGNDSPDHGHQWPLSQTQGGRDGNDTPARSMYGWDPNFRTGWRAVGGYNAADRPHQHTVAWSGDTDQALASTESVNLNLPPFMMLAYVIKY
jgi:microcystin-dependent protein